MKILLGLVLLLTIVHSSKILAILDSKTLEQTHWKFFDLLRQKGELELAYSFGKDKIELKYYDKFRYDHIVVMCTSTKEIQSKIKIRDIVSYFDLGGNVVVIGDVDTSFSFRKLFYSFGIQLEDTNTRLKDHFSNHGSAATITTLNYQPTAPFFSPNLPKLPLLYQGIGLNLVNYENHQLYNLIQAEATTFSKNQDTKVAVKAGTSISLTVGVQGLNNARALFSGSLYFFSNQALQHSEFGNKDAVQGLLNWVLKKSGIVKVKSMSYHGFDVEHKESLFNVGEKLFFSAEVEEFNSESLEWQPYITDDLQVELVMLDPWVRTTLVKGPGSNYLAQFHAPLKEGIYQFKISYTKPGFNFIKEAERVTIRPYKHDEFERFIFAAFPYIFGTCSTILATFIFIVLYLYSGSTKTKTE